MGLPHVSCIVKRPNRYPYLSSLTPPNSTFRDIEQFECSDSDQSRGENGRRFDKPDVVVLIPPHWQVMAANPPKTSQWRASKNDI